MRPRGIGVYYRLQQPSVIASHLTLVTRDDRTPASGASECVRVRPVRPVRPVRLVRPVRPVRPVRLTASGASGASDRVRLRPTASNRVQSRPTTSVELGQVHSSGVCTL